MDTHPGDDVPVPHRRLLQQHHPLITTDEAWQAQLDLGFSDGGDTVGLAFNIQRWEATARSRGWRVNAPRIPGLAYPTLDELERAAEARHARRHERASK